MTGQLNDSQINNILSSQVVGRLACTDGNQPYIVPVTFTYDGEYIYGQSNEGAKLEMLRNNPLVCFEVDIMTNMRNWQSVVVYGTFEELVDGDGEKARAILQNRVYPLLTSSTIHPYEHEVTSTLPNGTQSRDKMYRIKINTATGRLKNSSSNLNRVRVCVNYPSAAVDQQPVSKITHPAPR